MSRIKNADTISDIGCVPCILIPGVHKTRPGDIHHPFGRKGKRYHEVYCSCPWHHRGMLEDGFSAQEMGGMLGPSLAHGSRGFRNEFGSEEILLEVQKFLLQEFARSAWMPYSTPTNVRRGARELWIKLKRN